MKHKKTVVSYAQMHSVAAAARHFTIPRTTIARWMVDGYFKREMTKRSVKKGAGRPLTYSTDIEEQLLVWVLENRDLHLPITIPLLKAKALELIGTECPDFKASSGWAYKFICIGTPLCSEHVHLWPKNYLLHWRSGSEPFIAR